MPFLKLHLDWDQALLPSVTQKLLEKKLDKWIDLSNTLIVVPTLQSGRRLRESLALAATETSRAMLPPLILTSDSILTEALKDTNIASETCVTAAWMKVLEKINPNQFKTLFPIQSTQTTEWQLGMAYRFMQLRNELGQEGFSMKDTADKVANLGLETERWHQLAKLEAIYLNELQSRNLIDPQQARCEAADNYQPPASIDRIILAATPDPQILPLRALQQASKHLPVEVWIYGPDENLFDDSGQPLSKKWAERALTLEAWKCQLETLPDLKTTAKFIARNLKEAAPESVLIGLASTELNPFVTEKLDCESIPNYDPKGIALHHSGLGRLAELLIQLVEDSGISTVRTLLQHPDIQQWANAVSSNEQELKVLDKIAEEHLPANLKALLQFCREPALSQTLGKIRTLRDDLVCSKNFAQALARALQTIYASNRKQTRDHANVLWPEQAEAIRQLLNTAKEATDLFDLLPSEFEHTAFKHALRNTRIYPDRPKNAHDLLGWLELLWNDSPHLILAGVNEGIVPESIIGDAFLPEALREALGFRINEQRLARDAYLLEAICRRRAKNGRVDIIVPKSSSDGTPLKPSRLLFQSTSKTLLSRTEKLFTETATTRMNHSHSQTWELSPPKGLVMPESLSVSSLKDYLKCPFRFFLRHIMKMRTFDVEARELTPAKFGTLFHDTVAHLKGRVLDATIQQDDLARELCKIADNELEQLCGQDLSFALRLQREALVARINAFCQRQVEDVQAHGNTTICEAEIKFSIEIENIMIQGVIDRIDKRDGRTELIDYKTADSPKTPQEVHLSKIIRKEPPSHLPPEAHFDYEGNLYYWTDLQLPLYALSKKESEGNHPKVAYFNLAKTLDKSRLATWDNFTESHIASAYKCAEAIIKQIQSGIFWPPNPNVRETWDDFAPLFPKGIESSVNANAFKNYSFK